MTRVLGYLNSFRMALPATILWKSHWDRFRRGNDEGSVRCDNPPSYERTIGTSVATGKRLRMARVTTHHLVEGPLGLPRFVPVTVRLARSLRLARTRLIYCPGMRFAMARSKNGLRDLGPGGDKRPEFGPSYVLLPGQGAVTNYTL